MKRDAWKWAAILGGGALAYSLLGRKAEAASSVPAPGPLALPEPRPVAARPAQAGAAVEAWNRVADEEARLVIADDVEALARVLTSEIGNGPTAERVAIGWAARNRAAARGVGVAQLVCSPCGKSSGNRRPFSSRQPATMANRELAAMILASPATQDPTQGATNCFEPTLQDRLHAAGRPGHRLDARGVRSCWLRGLDYYGTVGRWDLFGPKGGRGARPVPASWAVDGHNVCCSGDKRAECRGKQPGDSAEV